MQHSLQITGNKKRSISVHIAADDNTQQQTEHDKEEYEKTRHFKIIVNRIQLSA
jgi:hypothetical protein